MSDQRPREAGKVPRISYAQNGEDILLDRLFRGHVGTYVDVGAHHPVLDSNTLFFYERGWTGVNVEPLPHLQQLLVRQRPRDLNLAIAVSDREGFLPFYQIPQCDGLSTLSPETAESHRQRGLQVVEGRVQVRPLADLIADFGIQAPDLLFIDVEGHEQQVLQGIPLQNWRPRVIVVESTLPLTTVPSHETWESILLRHHYLFAAFNGINRFYLRDDLHPHLHLLQVPVSVLDHYQTHEAAVLKEQVGNLTRQLRDLEGQLAAANHWRVSGASRHAAVRHPETMKTTPTM